MKIKNGEKKITISSGINRKSITFPPMTQIGTKIGIPYTVRVNCL